MSLPPIGATVTVTEGPTNYQRMTGTVVEHLVGKYPVLVEFDYRETGLRDIPPREVFAPDEIEVAA